MRRSLPWVLLVAVVVGALGWAAARDGGESDSEHVRRLASELRCMECQGLSLADANTPTARAARADIRERVQRGESDGEIRQAYVDKYGELVLLRPSGSGSGAVVWAVPVIVLVVGVAGIVAAVRRNRREPRLVATDDDRALVERVRRGERAAR